MATTLNVRYAPSPHVARFRSIRIIIDGDVAGTVKNGGTAHFPVSAGEHTVRAKMDWCRTRPVHVSVVNDSSVTVTASTGNNPLREFFTQVFHPSRFIQLVTSSGVSG
jgi:hypothetical protein